jgi:cellulose synthase/poly-beta-1,6-N-acetylglucosamine synthase-like glycosyltransferase
MELILIMALLEFFEISWQKGATLKELLIYNYHSYKESPFVYFARHGGFIYILFIILYLDLINVFTISILLMKLLDMLFKLKVISNIDKSGESYVDSLIGPVDFKISNSIRYSNIVIYPLLLFFALI